MPVEPALAEVSVMLVDVPVRLMDSDEESYDESLPSVDIAAVANLGVLFSDQRLDDEPHYLGEGIDIDVLCANFSRLSLEEVPAHDEYHSEVVVFDGPPSFAGCLAPHHVAVVTNLMEVMVIGAGTSKPHGKASMDAPDPAAGSADTLHSALAGLKTPIATSANPTDARASLEEARRQILEEGIVIAAAKRLMKDAQHEYNSACGLTMTADGPSRLGEVRGRGRVITDILGAKQPIYDTPTANLRAAHAAMAEMPSLEGEERVLQEKRVKDLLDTANEQQSLLDPGDAQQCLREPTPEHTATPAAVITPRVLPRIALLDGRVREVKTGVSCARASRLQAGIAGMLATRGIRDNDARRRLNLLAQLALLEEEGPIGPACFGPRIQGDPFPKGFTLPRDTPKYNGTAKPDDWLIDYTTAVGIAQGNKSVAVRYMPLMLAGSTRTWLNSLPAGGVNSWVDFEEAFVCNFTGTYKCPGRPRELAMCVQRPDEPLRDYIMRWTELRNSCEGVHEVQTIQYFIDGCRDGTLLKQKLMCSMPTSLAVLMAKADKYAMADSAMRVKVTASDKIVPTPATPKPARDNQGGQNNKRKADQLDSRSESKHVANMEEEAPATQAGSQWQRTGKNNWQPKLTFEQMLDAPCKMHTGAKPTTHTLRSINFLYRDTLLKLGLKEKELQPTNTVFHDIVRGQSCSPIGKIQLDVLFGDKAHFHREPIWFEVVDLNSPYHALLGRPALAKFMPIPHYTYLKMTMSGPKGIITVAGDYKKSLECAQDNSHLVDTQVIAEEKRQIDRLVAQATE
ncbi:hypothetical protein ZWY2020_056610 [Hordeum vulgare]|nr:hypothetical protein ZWY2020_056610 [Hordeum vulgare]